MFDSSAGDDILPLMKNEIAYFFPETVERKLVRCLDLDLLVCGFAEEKTNLETLHPFRTDPFFRLYCPVHGKLQAAGCKGAALIEPGRNYLFPANVPFRFLYQGEFTHKWIHFQSQNMKKIPAFRKLLSVPARPEDTALWNELLQVAACRVKSCRELLAATGLLQQLLLPFLEAAGEDDPPDDIELERFQPVLDYIAKHLPDPLTTSKLASICELRENDFSKAFHQAYGIPPKQYLTRMRIERAKELLLVTRQSVKEIAFQCGYENEFFFYRIFKKYTGITPTAFRIRQRMG